MLPLVFAAQKHKQAFSNIKNKDIYYAIFYSLYMTIMQNMMQNT